MFRFQAREAPPLLFEGDDQRPATSSEVRRGGLGFGKRAFGAGEATLSALLRFPRLSRVLVRPGSLLRQRSLLGREPVHDAGCIRDQRFLALKIAGELRQATVKFRLTLLRALLFPFERLTGERDAMQGRAAASFLLAQGRQGCGGERLEPRGFTLRARALRDFEEVGVDPPARLSKRRLMFAPGDEARQRLVTADRASELAVAIRLARLTLEAVDLGVDLPQYILDAGEIVLCALQPKLGFVPARVEAGDARRLLEDETPPLGRGGNDLANLALAHERRRARPGRGVGEQELHVASAHLLAVDAVGRTGVAFNASCDLDGLGIIEGGRRATVGIVEQEPNLGVVARGTPAGACEDHVLHARAAHVLERALAHHPAQSFDEVRLAATVRPDDAGQSGLDSELSAVAKALEAGQAQALELHPRDPSAQRRLCAAHLTIACRESFFARLRHGLAAISESRNQPRQEENLCETEGSPHRRRRKLVASGSVCGRFVAANRRSLPP